MFWRSKSALLAKRTFGWDHELKNLSYHAWRTACKSTTGPNSIKSFYQQSRLRTGSVRHARLNTQRKILETMWMMWLKHRPFDPARFAHTETTPGVATARKATSD
jgi:hypothetical protein